MADEQWMPGTHAELMESIGREWNLLTAVVEKLKKAGKMTTPDAGGWSPKDNLAHLAEWMKVLMGYHMDQRPSHEVIGLPEAETKDWDFDVMNALLFERNKSREIDDVVRELNQVYEQLTRRLAAMTYDDLLKPRREDDPEKTPILNWVLGDTSEHFAEHRETIEKLL